MLPPPLINLLWRYSSLRTSRWQLDGCATMSMHTRTPQFYEQMPVPSQFGHQICLAIGLPFKFQVNIEMESRGLLRLVEGRINIVMWPPSLIVLTPSLWWAESDSLMEKIKPHSRIRLITWSICATYFPTLLIPQRVKCKRTYQTCYKCSSLILNH